MLAELDLLDDDQQELRAESMIEALLSPMLARLDMDFESLGLVGGALAVVDAMLTGTPGPVPRTHPADPDEDPPSIETAPPEEEPTAYAQLYTPPDLADPFAEDAWD